MDLWKEHAAAMKLRDYAGHNKREPDWNAIQEHFKEACSALATAIA